MTGPPVGDNRSMLTLILPAQPAAVEPHAASVAPGKGAASAKVICVTPVRAPMTTPGRPIGVGEGVGVGPTAGEPPQPHIKRAAIRRTRRDGRGRTLPLPEIRQEPVDLGLHDRVALAGVGFEPPAIEH